MKIFKSLLFALVSCLLFFLSFMGLLGILIIDISVESLFVSFITVITENVIATFILFMIFASIYFFWDKEKSKRKFIIYWSLCSIVLIVLGLLIDNNYYNNLG